MLDVLITISEDTPRGWVNQCRASVHIAAAHAGFPVNVIEVPGVPGSIVQAMSNGIAQTSMPYVTWVDDDDWVLPNAFSCLAKHFNRIPAAICAREVQVLANGHIAPYMHRHHLTAWRRRVLDTGAHLRDHKAPIFATLKEAGEDVVDELSWVYMRRIRLSGGMKIRGS